MKSPIYTIATLCFLAGNSSAQEFVFTLYLEDAAGFKDTLELGYDPGATGELDAVFQEIDIKAVPFQDHFEARAATFVYETWIDYMYETDICHNGFGPDFTLHQTRRQITFGPAGSEFYAIPVLLSRAQYPVTARWESGPFADIKRNQSVLTDWFPGAWFDATCGYPPVRFYLHEQNQANLTVSGMTLGTADGDTLSLFFVGFNAATNAVSNPEPMSFWVYPNPFSDYITLQAIGTADLPDQFRVLDLLGRVVRDWKPIPPGATIDCTFLPASLYLFQFRDKKNTIYLARMIRNGPR